MGEKKQRETKCEDCRNGRCSEAGKRNIFMRGANRCGSFRSGENADLGDENKDYVEEYYEYMKRRSAQRG